MASEQDLIRAVADHFFYDGVARPEPLPEPYRTIWERVEDALARAKDTTEAVCYACRGLPDSEGLMGAILAAMQGDGGYESLAQLARYLPPIAWLWQDWIPRGMLTALVGRPGVGKDLVALDLTRRLTRGFGWPDGEAVGEGEGKCVYLCGEGGARCVEDLARAQGIGKRQLRFVRPAYAGGTIDLTDTAQQDRLRAACSELRPQLVVVDSLDAVCPREGRGAEEVRQVVGFLAGVASEFTCGMLILYHVRRRGPLEIADVMGSETGCIVALAPSVLALWALPASSDDEPGVPLRLEPIKTNLVKCPKGLAVTILDKDTQGPELRYGNLPGAGGE